MEDVLKALESEVRRFKAWADAYPLPMRSGEWESDYDNWSSLYDAFTRFVSATACQQWSMPTTQMVLYVIARDNETGQLIREVAKVPDNLVCLAKRAANSTEANAKWQIAVELSRMNPLPHETESLLLQFVQDEDEYVRRRSLMALADIGSPHVTELVEPAWHTGLEHQRMAVLRALNTIGSPLLGDYLKKAEVDGRQHLVQYAAQIRAASTDR